LPPACVATSSMCTSASGPTWLATSPSRSLK
jgi:hypothetical protein